MENLKFDIINCLSYIDSIEDFTIEFESKPSYDEVSDTLMYVGESIAVKSFLHTFVMKCKKESLKEEYDFVRWLRGRRLHWKVQQYQVVGSLDDRLEVSTDPDKSVLEKKKQQYVEFFRHNCRLIEMMIHDVMNNFGRMARVTPANHNSSPVELLKDNNEPESFEDLFVEGREAEPYFRLLRDHEYPLIGRDYNYLSKALKSAFCIWISEMQRQHVIKYRQDKVYAELLIKKVTGLKVFNASIFRKTNNKAELLYREYFRVNINKLSDRTGLPGEIS